MLRMPYRSPTMSRLWKEFWIPLVTLRFEHEVHPDWERCGNDTDEIGSPKVLQIIRLHKYSSYTLVAPCLVLDKSLSDSTRVKRLQMAGAEINKLIEDTRTILQSVFPCSAPYPAPHVYIRLQKHTWLYGFFSRCRLLIVPSGIWFLSSKLNNSNAPFPLVMRDVVRIDFHQSAPSSTEYHIAPCTTQRAPSPPFFAHFSLYKDTWNDILYL